MLIVDSHCHAGETWYEPVEILLHHMDISGVYKAVLVQHAGAYDNSYLVECASRFPGRFVVVAMVDTSKSDNLSVLERCAGQGVAGLRLRPNERSNASDPLAIWRKAEDLGLVVSTLGTLEDFASKEFFEVVASLPDLNVVIEHLAGVGSGAKPPYRLFQQALELANLPNTYIKLGGFGEITERPRTHFRGKMFDDIPPLLEMTYKAFGAVRMMWGSDFPPVSSREGYTNSLHHVIERLDFVSYEEREFIMGKTALEVFGFD